MKFLNKKNSQSGFTLLEILIAIVILSLLMLSIFTIVDSSITTQDTITKEDRETLQLEAAVNRFEIDYSQIWSPLFYSAKKKISSKERREEEDNGNFQRFEPSQTFPTISESGHPIPIIDNPDKGELIFYTISNRRKVQESRQSDFAWVQYKVVTSEKVEEEGVEERGASLELIRRYTSNNPYAREFEWEKLKAQTLLKNIKSFKFEFWNKKSKKFVESLRDIGGNLYLPTATRIIITWVDKNKIEHEVTRSFRPLWPAFDTELDAKELKKNSPKGNNSGKDFDDGEELDEDDSSEDGDDE